MLPLYVTGGVVVGLALLTTVFCLLWQVADPHEALIVSGLGVRTRHGGPDRELGFRVVTGRGVLRLPGLRTTRRLSLGSRTTDLSVACVTKQGLPVSVRGAVIHKVGDDVASIANAARRFCGRPEAMDPAIHELCSGHLRAIVGSMTIEEMIHSRDALTAEIRQSTSVELGALGLVVDSVQVQQIDEPSGYIANLGRPHAATVAAQARIAEAQRDSEATQAEQIAAGKKAAAVRDHQVQQAGYRAEVDRAAAAAGQAGSLAEADARKEVLARQTEVARLEADLAEQTLRAQVGKPADARAYETVTLAEAERDARIFAAQAEARQIELRAEAVRVRARTAAETESTLARAEADAAATRLTGAARAAEAGGPTEAGTITARLSALADSQEAVLARHLIDRWPQIVVAGARAFGVLDRAAPPAAPDGAPNGGDGASDLLARAVALGGTGIGLARNILSGLDAPTSTGPRVNAGSDGSADAADAADAPESGADPGDPGR
ncbi:MAG TPA: SPFH domain-containing protein [Mycobacteriales bacterium]|nr:SPFH domain-containing protein [Mycobacteriales bacterium]